MYYGVENGIWRSVFAVPSEIVDTRLKLCGEAPLKVLLALLRYNGGLDENALAEITGKPVPVVRDALEYLNAEGILSKENPDRVYDIEQDRPANKAVTRGEPRGNKLPQTGGERHKFTREEINVMADDDETVSFLLQECQQVLGKTLGYSATETIVSLYAHYGMKPDVILMVMQYCKSMDKANMHYIEKVAASWVEKEIVTHEQAEREIMRLVKLHSTEGRIKSAFGIYDRALVPNERKYIPVWLDDYGFDVPLIQLAYERCIESKGKLSFPYINAILTNWHKNGINTPKAAVNDMRGEARKRGEAKANPKPTSYDMDEIEKMLDKVTF